MSRRLGPSMSAVDMLLVNAVEPATFSTETTRFCSFVFETNMMITLNVTIPSMSPDFCPDFVTVCR